MDSRLRSDLQGFLGWVGFEDLSGLKPRAFTKMAVDDNMLCDCESISKSAITTITDYVVMVTRASRRDEGGGRSLVTAYSTYNG